MKKKINFLLPLVVLHTTRRNCLQKSGSLDYPVIYATSKSTRTCQQFVRWCEHCVPWFHLLPLDSVLCGKTMNPRWPTSFITSKTRKKLKERFLIGRRRTKQNVQIFEQVLFFKLRTTEKQLIQLILCQLGVGGWRNEKGERLTLADRWQSTVFQSFSTAGVSRFCVQRAHLTDTRSCSSVKVRESVHHVQRLTRCYSVRK